MNPYRENKFHTWIIKILLILPICVLVVAAIYGLMMSSQFPVIVAMILLPIVFLILWIYANDESTQFKAFLKHTLSILFISFIAILTCFCLFSRFLPTETEDVSDSELLDIRQSDFNEGSIDGYDGVLITSFDYSSRELFDLLWETSELDDILYYLEEHDGQRYWSNEEVCSIFAYAYQKGYLEANAGIYVLQSKSNFTIPYSSSQRYPMKMWYRFPPPPVLEHRGRLIGATKIALSVAPLFYRTIRAV